MMARDRHRASDRFTTGLIWISPWLAGFLLFTLLPVIAAAVLSFCQFDGVRRPVPVGFENWRAMAYDPLFWKVLGNTAVYAAVALPLGALLALGLALLLNAQVPGVGLWRVIIFAPTLVPLVAVGLVWTWMYSAGDGLINTALALIGVEGPAWLADARWTMPSMILLSLWGVGQTVVIYLGGLQDVPGELYDAAELDGAGPWQRLVHVTLPMISPAIFFNLVVGVIFVWQIFAVPYVMLPGGGPGRNAYFYSVYLYDLAFAFRRFGYACTLSWVQLGIILALTALAFRIGRRFVYYRGATP
ncbi:MAG: sugar ABC transporter permease [bacterium]|nr:sugar ABC transporter permease [bacterium]